MQATGLPRGLFSFLIVAMENRIENIRDRMCKNQFSIYSNEMFALMLVVCFAQRYSYLLHSIGNKTADYFPIISFEFREVCTTSDYPKDVGNEICAATFSFIEFGHFYGNQFVMLKLLRKK